MVEISNRKLTLLRKLNRKKYREKEKLFFIEGARAVEQLMTNGAVNIQEVYFDRSALYWQQQPWSEITNDYSCALIDEKHFAEVSDTDNPQGVMAVCAMPDEKSIEELLQQQGIVIATDRIQDPGNLGTIIRTAAWFGVRSLLSGKGTVDLFHPKVVRSTAGATGMLGHRNVRLADVLPEFEENGWEVLVLDGGKTAQNIREVKPPDRAILIIGNEANGVNENLMNETRKRVRIPSKGTQKGVESLNAGIASGIALYGLNK